MATISSSPKIGYVYDSTNDTWHPLVSSGVVPHSHNDAITLDISSSVIPGSSIYTYRSPFNMIISQTPRSYLSDASTSGSVIIDINKNGTSIFGSQKLSINENTLFSDNNSASVVVSEVLDNDTLTVDVDSSGTNAKNLKLTIFYTR